MIKRPRQAQVLPQTHIQEFFLRYPAFDYNSTYSVMTEFYRMCDSFGWDQDDPRKVAAREDLRDAMVFQFNEAYGTDADDINAWQLLCEVIGIEPIPDGLKACREVCISSAHMRCTCLTLE